MIHTLTDLLTHLLYYNNYIDSPYYCAYVARVTLLPACKYRLTMLPYILGIGTKLTIYIILLEAYT